LARGEGGSTAGCTNPDSAAQYPPGNPAHSSKKDRQQKNQQGESAKKIKQ